MTRFHRPLRPSVATAAVAALAAVAPAAPPPPDILVTAQRPPAIDGPATHASVTAAQVAATVNAVNVEDALRYLPSLIVRKRHVGDTQSPLATRTAGLGASARSLIYVDGALLSALIGNNNTTASPRWSLVAAQEIARIDVLYGPFSAAYPGNAIGAVVNIATRLPDALEATVTAAANLQRFGQYGTHRTLPARQLAATLGGRRGPLVLFASVDHVASRGQPLLYVTLPQPAATGAAGPRVTGAFAVRNRLGQPTTLLGASGIERQRQDRLKLRAALDVAPGVRLNYVAALFLNDTDASAETYLAALADGAPVYAGAANIDGRVYAIPPAAFSGGVYRQAQRHWSQSLSATGEGARFDWQAIATAYRFAHDVQRGPTVALPAAAAGGAGTITRLDGTGWRTLDLKGAWRSGADAVHTLGAGAHGDWFRLSSDRYATTDWISGAAGPLTLRSAGRTRTLALWAQDAWRLRPAVTLTFGARYERWRAYDGANVSLAPPLAVAQPARRAARVSPKAALAWTPAGGWTVRASFGEAWRFPTVGELYQIVTTPVPAVPRPDLRPEHARSTELAVERHGAHGMLRLSLFGETVRDALIAQSGPLPGVVPVQVGTFVQNVDRTRARGVEVAVQQTDLISGVDLSGSLTRADAETRRDAAFPAAVGRTLPTVPRWKASAVATWRPVGGVSLTAAARYASRSFGTLDHSDVVGNTYQGFHRYLVVDLRALIAAGEHATFGLGVDNVGRDRYFLFHPFPQRSVQADLTWRL